MRTSDTTNELAAALAKAQGEFPAIERGRTASVKTKSGSTYKYNYADLADIVSAITPALSKHGLSYSHECVVTRDPLGVSTRFVLRHASGQFQEYEPLWLPCDTFMAATQAIGSACTYGKRYTVQNGLGIATEQDDDGNIASGHDHETEQGQPQGTRTAKADHAKKLAAEHGMKTADQLPALTDAEQAYVIDVTKEIAAEAAREDKQVAEANLEAIAAFLRDKSEPVRKAVGPLWLKTMKVVNPNWKMKKEPAE